MWHYNVFPALTGVDGRLGFYTKDTSVRIPESPGCYAWFLPLWIYRDDLRDLMRLVGDLLSYDYPTPERQTTARFSWETLNLSVRRNADISLTDDICATWDDVIHDERCRPAIQQILIEASLLMPPLYVGRTSSLRRRYLDHTDARALHKNTFHSRFSQCVKALGLKIAVSDLLFVCITTPVELRRALANTTDTRLNAMLERVLMQCCRPPFSLK